jgi:hypothetical protein
MPYHDPGRPLLKWWFSSADAEGADEFAGLMSGEALERLERGAVFDAVTHGVFAPAGISSTSYHSGAAALRARGYTHQPRPHSARGMTLLPV